MRFKFGRNWQSFAKEALKEGRDFLDVGFGQGLALLLAQETGTRVFEILIDSDNEAANLCSEGARPIRCAASAASFTRI